MRRHRLVWHLALRYFIVSLAGLLALGWIAAQAFDRSLQRSTWTELEAAANLVAAETAAGLASDDSAAVVAAAERIAQATRTRITVILPDGRVLLDSRDDAARMENHAARPEVAQALAGRLGQESRYSTTRNERMLYVAAPVRHEGKIVGVSRAARSSSELERVYRECQRSLLVGVVVVAVLAGLLGLLLALRTSRAVEQVRAGVERLARGDHGQKLPLPEIAELASLAAAINHIADQLEERRLRIGQQGNEQEAVLASMMEGVLAVDCDERIIILNSAAADLIGNRQADLRGRSLPEVIRNADLRRFVTRALQSPDPIEDDVVLHGEGGRILRVRGTALRDGRGRGIGAVIVLNDVTHYRKLENLRRDFVANVSHELKTPIATIKGFVETLLEGALGQPENAERFLRIIGKQAERLDNIIEDLLSLSKIEQSEEAADLPLVEAAVRPVLETAVHGCASRAAERQITLTLRCDEDLTAPMNPPLLEQAVINLIDNAVKYSEPGREVVVEAIADGRELTIAVRDKGCGIAEEHIPRLFERFYRVDRARSRKLGGTGLGLAIVKHIVQAHRGRVSVSSTPGEGSVFSIHLSLPTAVGATMG